MELWMIFLIIAIVAVVLEIMIPTLFFINFAFAGIITSLISLFWGNLTNLIFVFLGISLLSIFLIKPFLSKLLKNDTKADFNAEYIGKTVKSIEPINCTSGAVTIYDERWEARTEEGKEEIPENCDVKIIRNESLILFVEKI